MFLNNALLFFKLLRKINAIYQFYVNDSSREMIPFCFWYLCKHDLEASFKRLPNLPSD